MMLFSPFPIKNVVLKNRIVMSPMCMYSAKEDGIVTDWHITHYASRAMGQVGLVVLESTGITPNGRISERDLGIWSDHQIPGLSRLVNAIKDHGAKAAIQISHAGRKAVTKEINVAPSATTYSERYPIPQALTIKEIKVIISQFKDAAKRAKLAGFDVIELHGAHGYLIHQFLSPLSNLRDDDYGGNIEARYRFLREIIEEVKSVWDGPLFVRLSLDEYHKDGNSMEDYLFIINKMKEQGIDLVDCSSGAIVPAKIDVYPGYQVRLADWARNSGGMPSGAVGLIKSAYQAEEILKNERADLIFIGRELLRNPYWALQAANELKVWIEPPKQYLMGWREILNKEDQRDIWAPGKDLVKSNG